MSQELRKSTLVGYFEYLFMLWTISKRKKYILITQYFDFILWKKFRCLAYHKYYCISIIAHFPQILLQ